MAPTKSHLREVMLFHFKEGLTAAASSAKICDVYGPDTTCDRTVRRWFERFRDGDTTVEDNDRSGRPSTVDSAAICALADSNGHLTIDDIANMLDISHGSVHRHLTNAGYINRRSKAPRTQHPPGSRVPARQRSPTHIFGDVPTSAELRLGCSTTPSV
jgi:hypothetical protein